MYVLANEKNVTQLADVGRGNRISHIITVGWCSGNKKNHPTSKNDVAKIISPSLVISSTIIINNDYFCGTSSFKNIVSIKKRWFQLAIAAVLLIAGFSACTSEIWTLPMSVSLDFSSVTLAPGETLSLTHIILPDEVAIKTVTWSSSDPDVATVADGVVTAITEGSAVITVTTNSGQKSATCILTVAYAVSGVMLDKTLDVMSVGKSQKLTATVWPEDAPDKSVKWESSNPDVAEVTDDGVVTAKTTGTATITVITEIGNRTATCTIKVASGNYIVMTTPSNFVWMTMAGNGPIEIDWDNGLPNQQYTLSDISSVYSSQTYPDMQPRTIIISGDITCLVCNGSRLTGLDVSNNTELTELNCYNNRLTNLDVSKNTALTNLDCSNNRLTSLDLSNANYHLNSVNCRNNQLAADALNYFFDTLPVNLMSRIVYMGNNPGTQTCDRSIATNKDWNVYD